MLSETLTQMKGIELFPVISLLIFVVVFTAVIIWTMRLDKAVVKEMENIPLNDNDEINNGDRENV